jgi:hypothetical protein
MPLVIRDDYGGGDSVIPINNDNGVGTPAWPKPINKDNGGGTKRIGSSPKPTQVNNDNVAKSTLAWLKQKPIVKVLGTSAWLKPINNAKPTSAKHCGGVCNIANRINNAKATSAKHCGGGSDSANMINIANAQHTTTKHYGGSGDSANRINNAKPTSANHYGGGDSADRINNAKPTSAKHYGGISDMANRINNAKPTSAKHYGSGSANRDNGGGADSSSVAGDNSMTNSTDVDACLPFWMMKTDAPPTELNITSNNSWVDEEACIR